jgi:hypothetical protein
MVSAQWFQRLISPDREHPMIASSDTAIAASVQRRSSSAARAPGCHAPGHRSGRALRVGLDRASAKATGGTPAADTSSGMSGISAWSRTVKGGATAWVTANAEQCKKRNF